MPRAKDDVEMSKRAGDPGYSPSWCIHFRSAGNHETCEAGVIYKSFPPNTKWPCFLHVEQSGITAPCEKLRVPTKEEVELHENWINERMDQIGVAMASILPFRKTHRGAGAQEIDCPVCKTGKLRFSISGYNGHCHAGCSTVDCVRWME